MAEVPININGVICDLYGRTITGPVKIVGSISRTDRQIGGGPIFPEEPPPEGGGGGNGDHIWGPTDPRPTPPIYLPPQVPPEMKPPEVPPPGTATAVPGEWPHSNMVPPEYIVVQYPGVGPVVVTAPPHAEPAG